MSQFEKYLDEMELRREREKRRAFNVEIAKGLQEKTHEQSLSSLYSALTFIGGVSDVLTPVAAEKTLQPVV